MWSYRVWKQQKRKRTSFKKACPFLFINSNDSQQQRRRFQPAARQGDDRSCQILLNHRQIPLAQPLLQFRKLCSRLLKLLHTQLCRLQRHPKDVAHILCVPKSAAVYQFPCRCRRHQQAGGKGVCLRLLPNTGSAVAAADVPQLMGDRPAPAAAGQHLPIV